MNHPSREVKLFRRKMSRKRVVLILRNERLMKMKMIATPMMKKKLKTAVILWTRR